MRCVRFWSAGPAPNLTAMRRPNLTLHRMAAPPRSLVIRESQRAAIGELTVRRQHMKLILLGNAGDCMSTMARLLICSANIPRLSLDEIVWEQVTTRKPFAESIKI